MIQKNISILGAGNGGSTLAADLSLKGYKVNLIKTSKQDNLHYQKIKKEKKITLIDLNKEKKIAHLNMVTDNLEEGIKASEIVIIFLPTIYQEKLIQRIAPYLIDKIILVEPSYLSIGFFKKYLKENFNKNIYIEAESSPIDCRIIEPGICEVLFKNIRNPISIYPKIELKKIEKILEGFNYNFVYRNSPLEIALHNPNLIVHTTGAIMSIPRIEYSNGNYWMYKEVFTPTVWNMVGKLDEEKVELLKKIGFEGIKYIDACKYRNAEDLSLDSEEIFFKYATESSPKGPESVNSRYIFEDVPQGLVLLEDLCKIYKVETPVCSALINLSNAFFGIDFRKNGRTLERLDIDNFFLNQLIEF